MKGKEIDLDKIEVFDSPRRDDGEIDWGLKAINAPNVWSKTKGEGVRILLMDTGVDTDHPELSHAFKSGYNFFERSHNVEDEKGHGSHVAGLLVGKNTGVAPEAELHVIKVLNDNGKGNMASVMDGITYAINYGFDVLCMSLGVDRELPNIFKERIERAYNEGIVMVCATGNDGNNESLYPARLDEVIAVGGVDKDKKITPFTNRGFDVLAPSTEILSSYKDGKYAKMTGTSMASPLVAGAIALLISHYKNNGKQIDIREIKKKMESLNNKILDLNEFIT
ncbi:S8 family peptidase [Bacillus sp. FSL W8-0445]|uniref:S8 family peptidase n=1 Tax=Bacillota TaxID=1239 RepID=UPI000779333F|nr:MULTISPECIES: S8 family peptidase [Bacillota]KYC77140.1 hypothetical protein B4092_4877 [Bacillus licheniformis]MDE1407122.1 S8 family peptidase [Bacillus licheniformis]NFT30683.1 peptidase S8 [Clostridium sporogenes]OJT57426.1 hypothetical protein BFP47_12040 [Bacillus licheniformis]OJT69932.1 hypothetical protein BFP46_04850 [Bacillus licheniformis]